MNKEIADLLEKLQQFTNTAVKSLQSGDGEKARFYFNLAASISGQLADKSKG
jgi:hypothetical protein